MITKNIDYKEVLNAPLQLPNDSNADTVGNWFKQSMLDFWNEGEDFTRDRKKSFADWDYELIEAVAEKFNCDLAKAECMITRALELWVKEDIK